MFGNDSRLLSLALPSLGSMWAASSNTVDSIGSDQSGCKIYCRRSRHPRGSEVLMAALSVSMTRKPTIAKSEHTKQTDTCATCAARAVQLKPRFKAQKHKFKCRVTRMEEKSVSQGSEALALHLVTIQTDLSAQSSANPPPSPPPSAGSLVHKRSSAALSRLSLLPALCRLRSLVCMCFPRSTRKYALTSLPSPRAFLAMAFEASARTAFATEGSTIMLRWWS